MTCCSSIPDNIGAGLTFDVLLTLTAYPATEWAVTLHLRGPSAIDLPAVAEGTQHRLHADADVTADWLPGAYWYTIRATSGAEVVEVESGQLQITPDMASLSGPYDGRTESQIALDAINAVLAKRATLDQERYRINNRELYRTPIEDLLKLRNFYADQVKREKLARCGGNPFGSTVRVRLR